MGTNMKELAAEARERDPETFDAAYREAKERTALGALIREKRSEAGLSQRELAKRAGTSQSAIALLEAGDSNPTISTLSRIAAVLNLHLDIDFKATA